LTGIAGVLASSETDAMSRLDLIFGAMENRGSIIKRQIVKTQDGFLAIGSCSHANQELHGLSRDEASMVVDGLLPSTLEIEEIGEQIDERSFSEGLTSSGAVAVLAISGGRLLAARDVLGQKPLYFGADPHGVVGFASLKTALAATGVQHPVPIPPGQLITSTDGKPTILVDRSLTRPKEIVAPEDEASKELMTLLVQSLSDQVPKDLALAFSGGLDSTLVARAATENDLRPELVTVGLKGQAELKHAREVSKLLGLDITIKELSQSEILESLPTVVRTVESVDPVLVGVSVPLFHACEVVEEMGVECLLAGQLSDELFAGYGRFDELAMEEDFRSAGEEVWKSVLAASSNDFEPGDKLAVSHRLELRCPFAFLPLVKYALKLPMSLKLKVVGKTVVRKFILRRVAADWKLPEMVVNRPKKAVQYSSGVQKILLREAKRRRMTLSNYLKSLN
jgi:asparagine synthase (glutamine-hydrolysing)